jgi:hypothetical protein
VKSILSQDHYSLLEVHRFAPKSEIVKAYHRLKAAFDPDSLATYSLFSPDEARLIAARIDEAFRVLIDERKKEVYDKWLQAREKGEDLEEPVFTRDAASDAAVATAVASSGTTEIKPFTPRKGPVLRPVPPGGFPETKPAPAATSSAPASAAAVATAPAQAPAVSAPVRAPEPAPQAALASVAIPVADEEQLKALFAANRDRDGGFYRAVREARGITLQQVSEKTKISLMYLRFIEDNNYRDLPAPVYLRGFLVQIGKFYRVEGVDALAEAYMAIADKRKKEAAAGAKP